MTLNTISRLDIFQWLWNRDKNLVKKELNPKLLLSYLKCTGNIKIEMLDWIHDVFCTFHDIPFPYEEISSPCEELEKYDWLENWLEGKGYYAYESQYLSSE